MLHHRKSALVPRQLLLHLVGDAMTVVVMMVMEVVTAKVILATVDNRAADIRKRDRFAYGDLS